MRTVLLDYQGRLFDHAPLRPFFYSLRSAGELIVLREDLLFQQQEPLQSFEQRLRCLGWLGKPWQLIALIPVEPRRAGMRAESCQERLESLGRHTQSDRIARLRSALIDPLRRTRFGLERCIVVFCDGVQRHTVTGEPFELADRRRHQLEQQGFISEPGDFAPFFSDDDLKRLHDLWPKPLDLTGAHNLGQANVELPAALKVQLQTQCSQATSLVAALAQEKKQALASCSSSGTNIDCLYAQQATLEALEQEFRFTLKDAVDKEPGFFASFTPKSQVQQLLRKHYGVTGLMQGAELRVIRFRPDIQEHKSQSLFFALAALVCMLVETGNDSYALLPEAPLLAGVELDETALATVLLAYQKRLQSALAYAHKQESAASICLLPWANGCGPMPEDFAVVMPAPPERLASFAAWKEALLSADEAADRFIEAAQQRFDRYRLAMSLPAQQERQEIDCEQEKRKIEQEQQRIFAALRVAPYMLFTASKAWITTRQQLLADARHFFSAALSAKTRLLLVAAASMLFSAPGLVVLWKLQGLTSLGSLRGWLPLFALVALSILPLGILGLVDLRRCGELSRRLRDLAQQRQTELGQRVETNARFLEGLCALSRNARNQRTVQAQRQCQRATQLRIGHFMRLLQQHLDWVRQTLSSLPRSDAEPMPMDALPNEVDCDFTRPLWIQASLHLEAGGGEYELCIEKSCRSIACLHAVGLRRITLKKEIVAGVEP